MFNVIQLVDFAGQDLSEVATRDVVDHFYEVQLALLDLFRHVFDLIFAWLA